MEIIMFNYGNKVQLSKINIKQIIKSKELKVPSEDDILYFFNNFQKVLDIYLYGVYIIYPLGVFILTYLTYMENLI